MSSVAVPAGLPNWVESIRPHQADAIEECVEHYRSGVPVVFLDGPTGTGKTLIAECVRRRLPDIGGKPRGLYVCSDKSLQDQFAHDFAYARVLKGRSNYATLTGPADVTADDCTAEGDSGCMWCDHTSECPYQVAKKVASTANLAVINTSYLLAEANLPGTIAKFSRQPFIIVDEADELESTLLNAVEYEVPRYVQRALRLSYPVKGAHKPTLVTWLDNTARTAKAFLGRNGTAMEPKVRKRWIEFVKRTVMLRDELALDTTESDDEGRWLRDYSTATFKMVPVMAARWGPRMLWRHSRRWLLMSATLISPAQMADELGMPFDFETVTVPMTFPVENRPIYLAGVASITYNADDNEYEKLADAIEMICERHPDERILVHTVSYRLTDRLTVMLRARVFGRPILSYGQARDKANALERFRGSPAAVLLAPSLTRGVDFKDDDCRVIVVAKVPYPSFGDRRVAARKHLPGGDAWYMVRTIRSLVQMTGRGVRSTDDWAVTYILDRQFASNTWRRAKPLFPQWWRDAVDPSFNPRQLMR